MITGLILAHFAIVVLHGVGHSRLRIDLSTVQMLYSVAVIVVAPLLAGGLLWARFWRSGAYLLSFSMLGALIFGGYNHFLSAANDNVAHMRHTGWGGIFLATSILFIVTESAGVLMGIRAAATPQAG